jgi:hypothetical protein
MRSSHTPVGKLLARVTSAASLEPALTLASEPLTAAT